MPTPRLDVNSNFLRQLTHTYDLEKEQEQGLDG